MIGRNPLLIAKEHGHRPAPIASPVIFMIHLAEPAGFASPDTRSFAKEQWSRTNGEVAAQSDRRVGTDCRLGFDRSREFP